MEIFCDHEELKGHKKWTFAPVDGLQRKMLLSRGASLLQPVSNTIIFTRNKVIVQIKTKHRSLAKICIIYVKMFFLIDM